jgi:hypothetical protein
MQRGGRNDESVWLGLSNDMFISLILQGWFMLVSKCSLEQMPPPTGVRDLRVLILQQSEVSLHQRDSQSLLSHSLSLAAKLGSICSQEICGYQAGSDILAIFWVQTSHPNFIPYVFFGMDQALCWPIILERREGPFYLSKDPQLLGPRRTESTR